jgi:hypothetical protein
MSLTRQAKGTLTVDKQVKVNEDFARESHVAGSYTKQTLSPIDFAKQIFNWIVYVFTSEQVYSNDGSKVIIYGGHESQYSGQAKGSLNTIRQSKESSNFTRQAKGSLVKTRQSKGSLGVSGQEKINEKFTRQLKIEEDFTREE